MSSYSPPKGTKTAPALGGQLRETAAVMDRLTSSHVDHMIASRRSGGAVSRDSLASLYTLATRLHSPAFRFPAAAIETREERHTTPEQIWGQLTMFTRPVLRQLEASVRRAQEMYGDKATSAAAAMSSKKGSGASGKKSEKAAAGPDDDEGGVVTGATNNLSTHTSELDESDMDEEIEALLQKQLAAKGRKKKAMAQKAGDGENGDAWRYAFGTGTMEDDEEGEDDDYDGEDSDHGTSRRRRRAEADEEEEEDDDYVDDRARARNLRAMTDAADEEVEEGNADEELAALKELYGEDFEADGHGFLGDEEDEDAGMEEDIELDDPANEGQGGRGYAERDGMYFGKGDILADEAGDFAVDDYDEDDGADGSAGGRVAAAEADEHLMELDAELEAALADPSLSELQKERLREKHMVRRMEEKRLFGTDWAMAGETAAPKRPRDALLEVDDLDFEYGMKSTPVVTEAFTAKLEDRIKQRIQDENYDDVQRRTALSSEADIAKPKYDAALDAQKSKMSLMDLYEKDFLERQRLAEEAAGGSVDAPSAEPLTEMEKDELRAVQMWQRLAQHLDALSNFHFTPKPVQEDLDARVRAVENQAAAVLIESVGNFATTRENALAPQDLYRGSSHRFADVGTEELTPQERHALRRSKKETGKKDKDRKEDRVRQRKAAKEQRKGQQQAEEAAAKTKK